METPIYTRLEEYHRKNRTSFAMPGHKNLRGLAPDLQKCDVTELDATVDLHHECDTVKRADKLLSELYNTRESFILTNGSTVGVQAMLTAVLRPGDTLLAMADCHKSVINTCALCGFKLMIAEVKLDDEFLIPTNEAEFEINNDIRAVIVTSPNYYGVTKDIRAIAEKCRKKNIPLLVDEAHGAHFIASNQLPMSAVELGADMVCESAHKTLNALTGAAYLHICSDRVNINRVKKALQSFETSSPSYPIAASADAARATLEETNNDNIIKECRDFREAIERATRIKVFKNDDITRIVLSFINYETTGFEVSERLSDYYGIDVEMADYLNIVLIVTPWNIHSDFMQLFWALRDINEMYPKREKLPKIIPPEVYSGIIEPQKGWFAETEFVTIDRAVGRTAAAVVTPYPPGTAAIVTGEIITEQKISYIKSLICAGAKITGVTENKVEVVK